MKNVNETGKAMAGVVLKFIIAIICTVMLLSLAACAGMPMPTPVSISVDVNINIMGNKKDGD